MISAPELPSNNVVTRIHSILRQWPPSKPVSVLVSNTGSNEEFGPDHFLHRLHNAKAFLKEKDVGEGEIVLLIASHDIDTIVLFLAMIEMGVTPCFLPYFRPSSKTQLFDTASDIIKQTGAKWIATTSPQTCAALDSEAFAATVLHFAADSRANGRSNDMRLGCLAPGSPPRRGPAYLQLTSGTTGPSRPIEVTHEALQSQCESLMKKMQTSTEDVFVGWLPLNHDMGLISQFFLPLLSGGTAVTISPTHWLGSPKLLLEAVSRYRGSVTWMPNFGFGYLARRVGAEDIVNLDLSSWRIVVNGAEMVRSATIANFEQLMASSGVARRNVVPAYGLGENVLVVTMSDLSTPPIARRISATHLEETGQVVDAATDAVDAIDTVSCGSAIEGTEVRVVDELWRTLGDNRVGRVVISGTSLCPRYIGNEGANISQPGGFDTGDLGFLDRGRLHLVGRKKEVAIVAGRNINPSVVSAIAERCLGDLHRRSVAFSSYSEKIGTEELFVACETTKKLTDLEKADYLQAIRLAVLESVDVMVSDILFRPNSWLPKTTSGKVNVEATRKKYMKERHSAPKGAELNSLVTPPAASKSIETEVTDIIAGLAAIRHVNPELSVFQQGIDSLGASVLLLEIESRFGVRISENFFEKPTARALTEILVSHRRSTSDENENKFKQTVNDLEPTFFELPNKKIPLRSRRGLIRGPQHALGQLPYGLGSTLQRALVLRKSARSEFVSELELVERCHRRLSGNMNLEETKRLSLIANTFVQWRTKRLSIDREATRYIQFDDPSQFLANRDPTKGIVFIVNHVARLHVPLYFLIRRNISTEVGIIKTEVGQSDHDCTHDEELDAANEALRARQVWAATRVLNSGGVTLIAGDGRRGRTPISVPFLGSSMDFYTGAANLALSTNSYLVPLFIEINARGRVTYRVLDNLSSSASASAENLTADYAALYESRFSNFFMILQWKHLKRMVGSALT